VGNPRYGSIKMLDDNGSGINLKANRLFGSVEFFF
jgi:hypothetical protein